MQPLNVTAFGQSADFDIPGTGYPLKVLRVIGYLVGADFLLQASVLDKGSYGGMYGADSGAKGPLGFVHIIKGYQEVLFTRLADLQEKIKPLQTIEEYEARLASLRSKLAPYDDLDQLQARISETRATLAAEERRLETIRIAIEVAK